MSNFILILEIEEKIKLAVQNNIPLHEIELLKNELARVEDYA